MIGEGEADVITRPIDFEIVPEVSEQKNFTPLPEYEEPSMTAPDMSDMPPELKKIMEDIKTEAEKDNHERPIPEKKEKPKGFWVQLKEKIKNFFRNLFR